MCFGALLERLAPVKKQTREHSRVWEINLQGPMEINNIIMLQYADINNLYYYSIMILE